MCLIPITLFIYQKLKPADVIVAEANLLFTPEEPLKLGFRSSANDVAEYELDDILGKIDLDAEDNKLYKLNKDSADSGYKI